MKKKLSNLPYIYKAAISVTLMAVVFISGLLLCCQVGLASIQGNGFKSHSCCPSTQESRFHEKASKACTCCGLSKNVFDFSQQTINVVRLNSLTDFTGFIFVEQFLGSLNREIKLTALSHGPPKNFYDVPFYIQHSNLRL